jgi:hypothetical protein
MVISGRGLTVVASQWSYLVWQWPAAWRNGRVYFGGRLMDGAMVVVVLATGIGTAGCS